MADYIETAMITYALKQSAITAIFGQRVFLHEAPERTRLPYVVLNNIAPSNDSEEFGKGRMAQPTLQWDCISTNDKTPCSAFLGAHAIMDAFANYQGTMEGVVVKIIWIQGPKTFPLGDGKITSIVETFPHYEEP